MYLFILYSIHNYKLQEIAPIYLIYATTVVLVSLC